MKEVLLAIVLIAVPVAVFSGYEAYFGHSAEAAMAGLGDLMTFKTIIADVQSLADKGDMVGAAKRITDFESAWDEAETAIRPLNPTQWGNIDEAADAALHAVRGSAPSDQVKSTLSSLTAVLDDPNKTP